MLDIFHRALRDRDELLRRIERLEMRMHRAENAVRVIETQIAPKKKS